MKRRQFLRALGAASATVAGFSLDSSLKFGFRTANAHTLGLSNFGQKTIVVVYLRGGNDGINTVIPHGYDDTTGYYRPDFRPNIAIPKPGTVNSEGVNIGALDLGGDGTAAGLGLHPAMQGMWELYQTGNLAIMPATHYASASRSHFSGQQYTESAIANLDADGWLNRYLVNAGLSSFNKIRGVGLESSLPHMLRGTELVSAFSDLRNFELGISSSTNEDEVIDRLTEVYMQDPDANRRYSNLLHDFGEVTLKDIDIIKDLNSGVHPELDPDGYDPGDGSGSQTYQMRNGYGTSTFARQIAQTGLLIKAGRGLEVASISRGGFDWHSNQGGGEATGNQYKSLKDISDGVKAFYDDLSEVNPLTGSPYMDNVLLMICSEFGRTSYENASLGVDHAHATSWFAIGAAADGLGNGTVNGGVYLGHENSNYAAGTPENGVEFGGSPMADDPAKAITNWIDYDPLSDEHMLNKRYLDHTIDYRNLYGEILDRVLSQNYTGGATPDMTTLLPDFTYTELNKIGFLV